MLYGSVPVHHFRRPGKPVHVGTPRFITDCTEVNSVPRVCTEGSGRQGSQCTAGLYGLTSNDRYGSSSVPVNVTYEGLAVGGSRRVRQVQAARGRGVRRCTAGSTKRCTEVYGGKYQTVYGGSVCRWVRSVYGGLARCLACRCRLRLSLN